MDVNGVANLLLSYILLNPGGNMPEFDLFMV
jgi:hypothetical protein